MKKLISVVVMLAFTGMTVFAAPGAMALAQDGADDLFADVQATPLTAEEAQAVEGEGPIGAVVGGIIGGIAGVVVGYKVASYVVPAVTKAFSDQGYGNNSKFNAVVCSMAVTGAAIGLGAWGGVKAGAMIGAALPTP
ncbi:MAG: hypothetical protein LBG76_04660 [Treponema sp.]|jgi:hypothetical protein|nr:hypothetical protein [Treponema sp.]